MMLNNGCMCCSVKDDLLRMISELVSCDTNTIDIAQHTKLCCMQCICGLPVSGAAIKQASGRLHLP